jgi:hypothetical protein
VNAWLFCRLSARPAIVYFRSSAAILQNNKADIESEIWERFCAFGEFECLGLNVLV